MGSTLIQQTDIIELMKLDINQIKNKARPLLKKAGVTRSAVFGSYVRGEEKETSDIDILVEVPRGTGLFAFVGLKHKLEDALQKKVDLVTYDSIHPRLKNRILNEQIPLI